ncbi:hypothetical protein MUK42_26538, partial [Musa troglodytarum]
QLNAPAAVGPAAELAGLAIRGSEEAAASPPPPYSSAAAGCIELIHCSAADSFSSAVRDRLISPSAHAEVATYDRQHSSPSSPAVFGERQTRTHGILLDLGDTSIPRCPICTNLMLLPFFFLFFFVVVVGSVIDLWRYLIINNATRIEVANLIESCSGYKQQLFH